VAVGDVGLTPRTPGTYTRPSTDAAAHDDDRHVLDVHANSHDANCTGRRFLRGYILSI
jgi:hypothetical protein